MKELLSLTFLGFAFVSRLLITMEKKTTGTSTDEAFHVYYVNLIRANKHKVPSHNKRVIGGTNECSYPSFFHTFLSYFSKEFLKSNKVYFSLFLDVLSSFCIATTIALLYEVENFAIFLVAAIYLIYPAFIFYSPGPRAFALTPRSFAQFLVCVGTCFLLAALQTQSILFLQISSIFLTISCLSSKFSVQVFTFIPVIMSFFLQSIFPLLFLVNIVFWCLIFWRKQFLIQVRGQVSHSIWYLNQGLLSLRNKWQWVKIFSLMRSLDFRNLWQILVFSNPLSRALILNLPLICFVYYIYTKDLYPDQTLALYTITSAFLCMFITNFGSLRIFGEPERYIEYAIPLILIMLFSKPENAWWGMIISIYCLLFLFYTLYVQSRTKELTQTQDISEICSFLKPQKLKRMLCTSVNDTFFFCSTNQEIVLAALTNHLNSKFCKNFYSVYPDVNHNNFHKIISDYSVERIIINKSRKVALHYDVGYYTKKFENNTYVVYEV